MNSFSFFCAIYDTNVQIERTWKDLPSAYICCATEIKTSSPFHYEQIVWENSDIEWMKVPSICSTVTKYLTFELTGKEPIRLQDSLPCPLKKNWIKKRTQFLRWSDQTLSWAADQIQTEAGGARGREILVVTLVTTLKLSIFLSPLMSKDGYQQGKSGICGLNKMIVKRC